MMSLQARADAEKTELTDRVTELTKAVERLKNQTVDKEHMIQTLNMTLQSLERGVGVQGGEGEADALRAEAEALQQALRDIAQAVLLDTADVLTASDRVAGITADASLDSALFSRSSLSSPPPGTTATTASPGTPGGLPVYLLLAPRSPSPPAPGRVSVRARARSLSPTVADSAFCAVRTGLYKRQMQVQELRGRLEASSASATSLRRQLSRCVSERRRLEERAQGERHEAQEARRGREEARRENQRLLASGEALASEKSSLAQRLQALSLQLEQLVSERDAALATAQHEQQRRQEAHQEKVAVEGDRDRAAKELERGHKVVEQLEEKNSSLRKEISTLSESLRRCELQTELLGAERNQLTDALAKAELRASELELALGRGRSEEASLRHSLAKLGALNEGLAQDKVQLSHALMQAEEAKRLLSAERRDAEQRGAEEAKRLLSAERRDAEQRGAAARADLQRLERDQLALGSEKRGVDETLALAQLSHGRLHEETERLERRRVELEEQLEQ
ncbi:ciliary rootlet coiled-coil protein 2-like, partial [Lampetra fluviatilis]